MSKAIRTRTRAKARTRGASGKFVSYLRVSTARQGRSGLGLEAQREAVATYLGQNGWELIAEHVEVESGRRDDRPELAKALAAARVHGATLVIAKLDRLARNVAFTANLMDSGVDFVCCDFPQANRLTIHVLAAVAEHESAMISERTKAALAAAKARGTKLGNPKNLTNVHRAAGTVASVAARREKADAFARDVGPVILEIRAGGAGLRATARILNERGVPTPAGAQWTPVQVKRVLRRLEGGSA